MGTRSNTGRSPCRCPLIRRDPPGAPDFVLSYKNNFITVNINPESNPDIVADACNLLLPNDNFSVYFSSHTIEHVHDVNKFFTEAYRVLQTNGLMITICPNRLLHQHSDKVAIGETCFNDFTPDELMVYVQKNFPNLFEVVQFNTRNNNFDFDLILRKK